jgi:Na+-driven multidrug efflux pump
MTFFKYDCMLFTLAFCVNGYINGTGHTRYTMIVNLVASFAVRLPLIWYLSRLPDASLYHISFGLPSASLVQFLVGIAFLFFAKSEREQRKRLQ